MLERVARTPSADPEQARGDRAPAEPALAARRPPRSRARPRASPTRIGQTIERAAIGGIASEARRRRRAATPSDPDRPRAAARRSRGVASASTSRAHARSRPVALRRGASGALFQTVEDEHVGADEEHDEALDHVGQVAGELRVDRARLQAVRRPEEQRAEEQRGEADADGGVAAEQRDRDPEEADRRRPGCRRRRSGRGSRACRARRRGRRTRRRSPSRGSGSCCTLMPP